ncbi:hypothetical protein [Actinotalea sp. C106]|uniref:hypothetical protein n=1 Tax=Actinotalea sp. C106 TaxID=2908644 RepID=UPI0020277D7D|nr:hypothetical protein [Actinotalea sp. C106]
MTRRPGRLARRGAVLGVLVLGLAGCMTPAEDGPAPAEPGGTAEPDDTAEPTDEASATEMPVLQVREAGGYAPAGTDFRTMPQLTVYADGRAVRQGPQIAIYPPPALPNPRVFELPEEDVDAFVTAAREAGLLDGAPDYGQPLVADLPTTVVELRVDGETVRHEVPAFGFERFPEGAPAGTDDVPTEDLLPTEDLGLTEEQMAAREVLTEVLAMVGERFGAGEGASYDVTAFALLARAAVPGTVDDGLAPDTAPWPLADVGLSDLEECGLVAGEDAQVLADALADASTVTLFEQDGDLYEVWPRPLLPHETSCEDLPGPPTREG